MFTAALLIGKKILGLLGEGFKWLFSNPVALALVVGLVGGYLLKSEVFNGETLELRAQVKSLQEAASKVASESKELADKNSEDKKELAQRIIDLEGDYLNLLEMSKQKGEVKVVTVKVPVNVPNKDSKLPSTTEEKSVDVMLEGSTVVCQQFPKVFKDQFNAITNLPLEKVDVSKEKPLTLDNNKDYDKFELLVTMVQEMEQ